MRQDYIFSSTNEGPDYHLQVRLKCYIIRIINTLNAFVIFRQPACVPNFRSPKYELALARCQSTFGNTENSILPSYSVIDLWPENERLREITRSMFPDLWNFQRRSFLQRILHKCCLVTYSGPATSSCGMPIFIDLLPLSIPLKFIYKKNLLTTSLIAWF